MFPNVRQILYMKKNRFYQHIQYVELENELLLGIEIGNYEKQAPFYTLKSVTRKGYINMKNHYCAGRRSSFSPLDSFGNILNRQAALIG